MGQEDDDQGHGDVPWCIHCIGHRSCDVAPWQGMTPCPHQRPTVQPLPGIPLRVIPVPGMCDLYLQRISQSI